MHKPLIYLNTILRYVRIGLCVLGPFALRSGMLKRYGTCLFHAFSACAIV